MLVGERQPVNIAVKGEKIVAITGKAIDHPDNFQIQFAEAIAFPGLINSHDHLDFNCFSILGKNTYPNYSDWGNHIHESFKGEIEATLQIPVRMRAAWGMYKNLVTGVTTVVNHGRFLKIPNPIINIYQKAQNIHSVLFEKKWKWKLNNPMLKNKVCVIHTGEGVDEQSHKEISELLKYNLLRKDLIAVHGVAMDVTQADKFKGLIWCPESNRVLLNKHANIEYLKAHTTLVFGTDSTLTGSWNIWEHLRLARSLQQVNDMELFKMVTSSPARLWNMNCGELAVNKDADIVIAKINFETATLSNFYNINPENILMVIHKGNIRMFDKTMLSQLNGLKLNLTGFNRISINGDIKHVKGDLPTLMKAIRQHHPRVNLPFDIYEENSSYHTNG